MPTAPCGSTCRDSRGMARSLRALCDPPARTGPEVLEAIGPERAVGDKSLQYLLAASAIEVEQTRGLRQGETESRHLAVLSPDAVQCVGHTGLLSNRHAATLFAKPAGSWRAQRPSCGIFPVISRESPTLNTPPPGAIACNTSCGQGTVLARRVPGNRLHRGWFTHEEVRMAITKATLPVRAGREPFGLLRQMTSELDRVFDDPFFATLRWPRVFNPQAPTWSPDIDVFEKDNQLITRIDLPGLKKERSRWRLPTAT